MIESMKINYVGACSDLGVHIDGASKGPRVLFKDRNVNIKYFDMPNVKKSLDKRDLKKNFNELYGYLRTLYNHMNTYDKGEFVSLIGGDHSIAIPSALSSVHRNGEIGLIWIDAHTDYHTMASTTSGNLHGLPCACINGFGANDLFDYHLDSFIKSDNTVIIGARSIDDGEYINLAKTNVKIYTMDEVKSRGIPVIMKEAIAIANKNTTGIHLSYDLDFLDPSIAPGVSTDVLNGGSLKDYEDLLISFKKYRDYIISFDLVEYNPLNDVGDMTKKLALRILDEANF